jgi:hypothetical protein
VSRDLEYGELRDRPLAWLRDNDPDWRDAQYLIKRWPENFDTAKYTSYDESHDYGGPADKANYETWKKDYAKTEGKSWWDLGPSSGILVRIQLLSHDEKEAYENLESGEQLDDTRSSEIEWEVQKEAWDKYDGRSDFKKAILDGADDEEKELVEELLDAMPEAAFDRAVQHAQSDNEDYPEMEGGWHVRFPDPDNLLFPSHKSWKTSQPATWDRTAVGLIEWMAKAISSGGSDEANAIVKLSDKAFCRVSPEDAKTQTWPGATYTKYGWPMALDIKWQDVINTAVFTTSPESMEKLKVLFDQYADDKNVFIGQGPSIEIPYNKDLCRLPYLSCELKFIADAKARIIGGPAASWTDETDITDEMVAEQQKFDAVTAKMRNLALEGALRCNLDPADDLVEDTTAELLWLYRDELAADPFKEKSYYAVKSRDEVIMENACDITQKLVDKLPAVCDLRQLKFPFASENQRKKHQPKKLRKRA